MTRRSYDRTFISSFLSLFHEEFRILFTSKSCFVVWCEAFEKALFFAIRVAIDTRTISTMTVRHFLDTIRSIISLLDEPDIHQKSTGTYVPGEYRQ